MEYEELWVALVDEVLEWNHRYQTYTRRYIEVTPANRGLSFAPIDEVWKLMLRQEASIDGELERKTRLRWEMQEVDRQRQEQQWPEIVAQAAETRQIQARDQDAEMERKVDQAVLGIVKKFNEIRKQSRQGAENKRRQKGKPGPVAQEEGSESGRSQVRRERNSTRTA